MTKKLFLSQAEKVKTEFWLLNQDKLSKIFFYLLILFLPTQLGKHFWPKFSFVFGLRLDYLSPTIYLTDVFILLIFLFSFKKTINEVRKINKKYLFLYALFILSLCFGLLSSINPLAGIYGIIKILEFSFLAFYVSVEFKRFNKKIIFTFFSIGILFESCLSVFQFFSNSSLGGFFYFFGERAYNGQTPGIANATINGELFLRPYATFSHPNVLAGYLIISVLYLLLLNKEIKKIKTILFMICISAVTLILSLSRATIILSLTYALYCFGLFIVEKFKNGKSKTAFILIALLLPFLFMLLYLLKDSEIFQRFAALSLADESVVQRQELISQAITMTVKNPLFGTGINNFYNNIKFINPTQVLLIQPVHNIFFLVLSETGIVGFVFFILVFFKASISILKNTAMQRLWLMLIFFAIIFLGLFDHYFLTIQQGQLLLTLFLGTAFSYKKT